MSPGPFTSRILADLCPEVLNGIEQAAIAWAGGSALRLEDTLDEVLGVVPAEDNAITLDLPLEVQPMLSRGRDGPHFGYLIVMPELGLEDAPVVSVAPDQSVHPFARGTREALLKLLALRFEEDEDLDVRQARSFADALRLPESLPASPPTLLPALPVGYRHRPGADGIGVVAPAASFGPTPIPTDPGLSLAELQAWAGRLLYEELPGAALAVVKDACFAGRRQSSTWDFMGRLWASSYEGLGRAPLAAVVRHRIGRFA